MPKLTPDLILQEIDERRRLGKGDLLTREALGSKTGEASRVWSVNSLEDRVSDTIDAPKEVIRVKQGRPAAELLADWNGWMPPVADWEHDRLGYDDTYKYQYVPEWTKHTPSGEHCAVNTTSNAFSQGFPISNKAIMKIRYNHDTIPGA